PARIEALPLHLVAKSDSVVRPYLDAAALVTANAFWSAACDGLPTLRPSGPARAVSAATVAVTSPLALGVALAPLTFWLRNSVRVAAYSGNTVSAPLSSAGS